MIFLLDIYRSGDVIRISSDEYTTDGGVEYRGDMVDHPQVTTEIPDLFYGVSVKSKVTINFLDKDNGVNPTYVSLNASEDFRGCKAVLRRADGTLLITGKISEANFDLRSWVTITEQDESFNALFPLTVISNDNFPVTALDIGLPVPLCFGYCKNSPCYNIQNYASPTSTTTDSESAEDALIDLTASFTDADIGRYAHNISTGKHALITGRVSGTELEVDDAIFGTTGDIYGIRVYDYVISVGPIEGLWIDHDNGRGVKRDGGLVDEADYTFDDGSGSSSAIEHGYTGFATLRFAKEQVDFTGARHAITADVYGMTLGLGGDAVRNFATILEWILSDATHGLGQSVDSASNSSFAIAEAALPVVSWMCDYSLYEQKQARDYINKILFACHSWLYKNSAGEWEISVDGTGSSVASFGENDLYLDNCEVLKRSGTPTDRAIKTGIIEYDNKQISLACQTDFGTDKTYSVPCIFEDVTAKKILSYVYGRSVYADQKLSILAGQEGEDVVIGNVITVSSPRLGITNQECRVIKITRGSGKYTFDCEYYSSSIFDDQVISAPTALEESSTTYSVRTISDGTVGGMTVLSDVIMTEDGLVGLSSTVTGGVDWRIWAGNVIPGSAPFRVDEDGNLFAESATITGDITATTGNIGGWVVSQTAIKDLTGTVGLSSEETMADDVRFWAGHATPTSAPFYVTQAGVLIASNATISGDITAETGHFQSVTLGKTDEISGSLVLQILPGGGDTYIAAGKTDFTTSEEGFILGIDDGDDDKAKFYIGGVSQYLYWDGTELVYTQGLIVEPVIRLFVDGEIKTSDTALDGTANSSGILINRDGIYAAGANQNTTNSNIRILATGEAYFKGDVTMDTGYIGGSGGWVIAEKTITGAADSKIISGLLESSDWGTSAGAQLDLANSTLKFGGSDSPKFEIASDGTFSAIGGTFKSADSGPRVTITASGIKVYTAGAPGKYNEFQYNDGTKYIAGALEIGNPDLNVPIYFSSITDYADIHLVNRSSDPSGAAEIGDLACVSGKLKICTVAGTPGTWTVAGTQT